jgi:hypothetical protein
MKVGLYLIIDTSRLFSSNRSVLIAPPRPGSNPPDAGVVYDVEIDSSHTESLDCARVIAARVI